MLNATPQPAATLPPAQPLDTPAPAGNGEVLFQDDFSDPNSGWKVDANETTTREYVDRQFRIFVNNDEFSYVYPSTYVEQSFGDVRMELDVQRISGDDSSSVYLICRRADQDNFIAVDVDFEGEARIAQIVQDEQEVIVEQEGIAGLQDGVNQLRLDCIGNTVTFFLNGQQILSAEAGGPAEGGVGFAAGGAGSGQSDFRFDNLFVYRP
jgi:hypothetical protein